MKLSVKVTITTRQEPDERSYRVRMRNHEGDWWLVGDARWSDLWTDAFVFASQRDAEIAIERSIARLSQWNGNHWRVPFGTRLAAIPFKKGS